jgi:hypothetical protein
VKRKKEFDPDFFLFSILNAWMGGHRLPIGWEKSIIKSNVICFLFMGGGLVGSWCHSKSALTGP